MERATECRLSHAPFRLRLVKRLIETDRQAQTEKSEREASLSSVTLNNRTVSSSFQSKVVPPQPYRLLHSSPSHSTREFQLFIGTKKEEERQAFHLFLNGLLARVTEPSRLSTRSRPGKPFGVSNSIYKGRGMVCFDLLIVSS